MLHAHTSTLLGRLYCANRNISGLIVSLSLLFAGALAVYENPQVKEWVDARRRELAVAIESLGEEISPRPRPRNPPFDASAQEDRSPEAEERRRAARQEILERGMFMEMRRRRDRQGSPRDVPTSFDHIVDSDGRLRDEGANTATATTTAIENPELRRRNTEHRAAVLGAAFASPFDDEMPLDQYPPNLRPSPLESQKADDADLYGVSRSSTPVPTSPLPSATPITPSIHPTSPFYFAASPSPSLQPESSIPANLLIDTDNVSNHPSEELLDLTPTTSVASLPEMEQSLHNPQTIFPHAPHQLSQANLDINEWAHRSTASFYSMPDPPNPQQAPADNNDETEMERAMSEMISASEADSVSEAEHVSKLGSEADVDVMSEISAMTPSTWTEVGSVISEEYQ